MLNSYVAVGSCQQRLHGWRTSQEGRNLMVGARSHADRSLTRGGKATAAGYEEIVKRIGSRETATASRRQQ